MTALNAQTVGSRAYIVTDTAAYDAEGIVGAFVNKTLTIPHLRMAIATRGSVMALPDISIALTTACRTFDGVLDESARIVEETYHDRLLYWHDLCGMAQLDVMIVGYSERQKKAVIGFLSSRETEQYGAFELYSPGVLLTPPPPEDELRSSGILSGNSFDSRRPAENLLKVLEIQRRTPQDLVPGDPATARHWIGGHAVLTEISEHGITQRVAKLWPDTIGAPIRPDPAPAIAKVAAPASGMSRQQRRAADREARKRPVHAA